MPTESLTAIVTADISQFQSALAQMTQRVQQAARDIQQAFGGQTQQSLQAIQRYTQQMQSGFQSVTQATTQLGLTARQTLSALQQQTTQVTQAIHTMARASQAQSQQMAQGFQQVTQALQGMAQAKQQASQATGGLSAAFGAMKGALGALGIGLSARQLLDLAKASIDVTVKLQQVTTAMKFLSGSATAGAETMAFLRVESQRLGVNFLTTAQSFQRLEAAARGTKVEGEEVRKLFTAFVGASRVMGSGTEQVRRGLVALEQAISKGKLSAEEMRQQLSESLPNASQIMARALGVTTAALEKMLQEGRLLTDDWAPQFRRQLEKEFAGGIEAASKDAVGSFARFKNAMTDLGTAIGPVLLTPLVGVLNTLTRLIERFTEAQAKAEAIITLKKRAEGLGVDASRMGETPAKTAKDLQREYNQLTQDIDERQALIHSIRQDPGFATSRPTEGLGGFFQRLWSNEPSLYDQMQHHEQRMEALLTQREKLNEKLQGLLRQEARIEDEIKAGIVDPSIKKGQELATNLNKILDDTEKKLKAVDQQARLMSGFFSGKDPKRIPLPMDVDALIHQLAPGYGLDPRLIQAMVYQESGGRRTALSPAGAQGLMQLMPATAQHYNVRDPYDAEQNLRGGMQYMRDLMQMWIQFNPTEQLQRALASYNAGPGRVKDYGGVPPFAETKGYVKNVMGMLGGGAEQTAQLDIIRTKIQDVEKGMEKVNEELAKSPALAAVMPPKLQEHVDKINAILKGLREQEQQMQAQIDAEKLALDAAKTSGDEKLRLEEEIRQASLKGIREIGEERLKHMDLEAKEAQRIADQIADLRIDVAKDTAAQERKEHQETLDKFQQIKQRANQEMVDEQRRAQQEVERFAQGIQRTLSNTFFQIFKGNKDIFQGILDLFLKLLADMAAAALTNEVIIPVITRLFGANDIQQLAAELNTGQGSAATTAAVDSLGNSMGGSSNIYRNLLGNMLNYELVSWRGSGVTGSEQSAMNALGSGGATSMSLYGTQAAGGAASAQGLGGGGGGISAGSAIAGVGTGIAAGYMTSQGLSALGLGGKSRSGGQIANNALSGLVGGAAAGAQMTGGNPYAVVIGAVIGLIGGLIAGFTAGMRDRQKFDITEQRPARYRYDEVTGLQQVSGFLTETAKTSRLDTYTKEFGMSKVSQAADDLFETLAGQIRGMDPALQEASAGWLTAMADTMATVIEETKFTGKDQLNQIKSFIQGELPESFNAIVGPLVEGLNVLQPIIAQFREVINTLEQTMDALEEQQLQLRASLASQAKAVGEAFLSDVDLFAKRHQELVQLRDRIAAATPREQINLIAQSQELIDQIFELGNNALRSLVGQFEEVVNTLTTTMDTLTQQQAEYRANIQTQAKGLEEAMFTDAMLYMRRQGELSNVMAQIRGGTPEQRINLIPQAQQLIDQIFQLGRQETVLGQEPEAVRMLQGELLGTLRQLESYSESAFESAKSETQQQLNVARQQLDVLRTTNATGQQLVGVMQQSLGVLATLQGTAATSTDIQGVNVLQHEMIGVLQDLGARSEAAFETLKSETQSQIDVAKQQIDYMAANLTNTANLNVIAAQSLTVLGDLRQYLATGIVVKTVLPLDAPAQTPGDTAVLVNPPAAPSTGAGPYGPYAPPGGMMGTGGIIIYPDGSTYNTATGETTNPNGWASNNSGNSFQHGTPYVPMTGMALLHRGEAVIPEAINTQWRSQGRGQWYSTGSQSSVTIQQLNVNVDGAQSHNVQELAQHVGEAVRRELELRTRLEQTSLRGR